MNGQSIAVLRGGACLAELREEGRDQAARLLPAIAETLERAGVARRDVELVAVTVGPGSFTGVRVGLAAARGLAVGLGVPLAGLSTTSVLLAQISPAETSPAQGCRAERLAVAAVDTHLGDWFCALGEGDALPFAVSSEDLAVRLAGRACRIAGAGIGPLVASLTAAGIDAVATEGPLDAVTLARLAAATGAETWAVRNRDDGLPRPLYLRGVNITLPDGARRTVE